MCLSYICLIQFAMIKLPQLFNVQVGYVFEKCKSVSSPKIGQKYFNFS